MAISGGSPQLKGSFLHKAVSAEKAVENASPKMVRTAAHVTVWQAYAGVPQARKLSEKKKFFKVREKSGNVILSEGKLTF